MCVKKISRKIKKILSIRYLDITNNFANIRLSTVYRYKLNVDRVKYTGRAPRMYHGGGIHRSTRNDFSPTFLTIIPASSCSIVICERKTQSAWSTEFMY